VVSVNSARSTQFKPISEKFEVFPNYRNPFNSQTVVEYAIPVQSDMLINILIMGTSLTGNFRFRLENRIINGYTLEQ